MEKRAIMNDSIESIYNEFKRVMDQNADAFYDSSSLTMDDANQMIMLGYFMTHDLSEKDRSSLRLEFIKQQLNLMIKGFDKEHNITQRNKKVCCPPKP